MRGPRLVACLVVAAVLAPALLSCSKLQAGGGPRDVILITIDTMRQDRLGCYGYYRDTSPNLDRFAAEAVLFDNVITVMGTTLPAHVSLMTATGTTRHGIKGNVADFRRPLDSRGELRTAAQIFNRLGYETAGFVSAAPLKTPSGIDAGFHFYREPEGVECRAEETTDAVLEYLDGAPPRPLFLWIHYFDPHDSYSPPPPYDSLFTTSPEELAHLESQEYTYWDHPQIQLINRLYDGEVRYLDQHLGRLFAGLEERGLWKRAAVVVAGDHGEGMGQHDWVSHDRIHDEILRVPLILRLPGVTAGRSARLVSIVDVLPTLAEELDLPLLDSEWAQFEGRNVFGGAERDYVFSERVHGREKKVGPGLKYGLTGLEWKYLHFTEGSHELFDLVNDPRETHSVLDEHPERAAKLEERVLAILAEERERNAAGAIADSLPAEHLEQLRALGYVD